MLSVLSVQVFGFRDTAGQERYASLAPLYYRGASAAAVVYDVTNRDTLVKAKHWVDELQKNASGNLGELRCIYITFNCSVHLPTTCTEGTSFARW